MSETSSIEAFKTAAGMEAGGLADVIVVSFFGVLLIIVTYIAVQQYKELEKGGNFKTFVRNIVRAVFIVIVCSVFLV